MARLLVEGQHDWADLGGSDEAIVVLVKELEDLLQLVYLLLRQFVLSHCPLSLSLSVSLCVCCDSLRFLSFLRKQPPQPPHCRSECAHFSHRPARGFPNRAK